MLDPRIQELVEITIAWFAKVGVADEVESGDQDLVGDRQGLLVWRRGGREPKDRWQRERRAIAAGSNLEMNRGLAAFGQ
jgi:hypothetical protein